MRWKKMQVTVFVCHWQQGVTVNSHHAIQMNGITFQLTDGRFHMLSATADDAFPGCIDN